MEWPKGYEEHMCLVLVQTVLHPGGMPLITDASYKWLIMLGENILLHRSRESMCMVCENKC